MTTIKKCFPGGKFKALTLSYDDGRIYDKKLIEILNKYKIKGTFHLNSGENEPEEKIKKYGNRISLDEIKEVYKGHEVASHTVNHHSLLKCSKEEIYNEIFEDRKKLEKYTEDIVRGFSYPYGDYNEEIIDILKSAGIEYARTVNDTESFEMPKDFYKWNGTVRHRSKDLFKLCDKFLALNNNELSLFYLWGHSYEFNLDNNWNVIEEFCKRVGMNEDIWYATNIEIINYMKVLNNLKFSADNTMVYNPSFNTAYILVNDKIYSVKSGKSVMF